jgi:hypothetical protein
MTNVFATLQISGYTGSRRILGGFTITVALRKRMFLVRGSKRLDLDHLVCSCMRHFDVETIGNVWQRVSKSSCSIRTQRVVSTEEDLSVTET